MSTRIIIEKDGERWELKFGITPTVCTGAGGSFLNVNGSNYKIYKLPPVIRTDNGEVIARLEADKKRLHEATIHLNRSIEKSDAQILVLQRENEKLRKEYDKEHLSKLKVVQHEGELITANYELREENEKLREALKDVLVVAEYRLPTIPTVFEREAIGKAQEIMKGGAE